MKPKAHTWTLAGRTTRTLVVTTVALTLSVSAVGAWFLKSSLERELAALIKEEFEELELVLPGAAGDHQAIEELVQRMRDDHPTTRMAFRVWDRLDAPSFEDFGDAHLIPPNFDLTPVEAGVQSAGGGLRWRTEVASNGNVICVLLDGSAHLRLMRNFGFIAALMAVLAAAVAMLGGALFVRRTSRMLRHVADQVRDVRGPLTEARIRVEGAPEEIRTVADALSQTLTNIRAESERARLLTTGMAHELGSPIQNLIGEAQLGLMGVKTPGEYRGILESQLEELRDLARTLGNLVALCSSGSGRSAAEGNDRESFDLGEEAELHLGRERAHAQRRGVEFELSCDGDYSVLGDREALMLALSNVVSNAIDWSPKLGRVRVAIDGDARAVRVTVDDSGPGIPDSERDKVFEPFYRGQAAAGRRQGYGIGLSLTRAAIQAHGGEVVIADSPLGGARFVLTIPRRAHARELSPLAG